MSGCEIRLSGCGCPTYIKGEKLQMEKQFIQHGDNIVTITGNTRCTNGDCPYIKEVGDCPGNIENCEYRQQRNDAFLNYTFDGL